MLQLMAVVEDGVLVTGPHGGGDDDGPPASSASATRPSSAASNHRGLRERLRNARRDEKSFVWISLTDPDDHEINLLEQELDLSRLHLDDATNPRQRAKVELGDQQTFAVFKVLSYLPTTKDTATGHHIRTGQVSVFIGTGYAITVSLGLVDPLAWVVPQLSAGDELLRYGPTAILHSLLDRAVDGYLDAIDRVGENIEAIEVSVFSNERRDHTGPIYELKRENLEIRRAVEPLLLIAANVVRREVRGLPTPMRPYFRDIADHLLRAGDAVEANDSLLLTMLMAATARLDLQQNADMRRISAWVAIAAVPTMIAAIYGMNFDFMPELHSQWGYPAVLAFMALVCLLLYRQFKKSSWL